VFLLFFFFIDGRVVIIRPCIVMGPQTANYMVATDAAAKYAVRGRDPKMQFLHEDDFTSAVHALMRMPLSGTFNLVPCDDGVERSELMRLFGIVAVEGSYSELHARLLSQWVGDGAEEGALSPAWLPYIMFGWAASHRKLAHATGFVPRHDSTAALLAYSKALRAQRRAQRRTAGRTTGSHARGSGLTTLERTTR
jgi:nucleoside-diphosphate-sugar epimerase